MNRLRQVLDIGEGLYTRSLAQIQQNIDNTNLPGDAVVLTVFNPSPRTRDEVAEAVIDLPWKDPRPRGQFGLRDAATGEEIPVQCAARKPHWAVVNHAWDAPAMMRSERFTIYFSAKELPGLGYASYVVDTGGSFSAGTLVTATNTLENEWLRATIHTDGTITLLDKQTGITYRDLHYFVDEGEAGHAWMHVRPAYDRAVDSRGFPVSVALEEDGPLLARFRVEYRMRIPGGLQENGGDPWQRLDGVGNQAARGGEEHDLLLITRITLRKDSRSLEFTTRFDNNAQCHRLRLMIPTRRPGTCCHAESAFDVVERETVFTPQSVWHGAKGVCFPMQRFVDVSDGAGGIAFISSGLREYEVTEDENRCIAVTLLRAYEVNLTTVSFRWEQHPEMLLSQNPGLHEFSYRLYAHPGRYDDGGVLAEAEKHVIPVEVVQAGAGTGRLPQRMGFLTLESDMLQITALKRSENGAGWIIRLHNPTRGRVSATLGVPPGIGKASEATLEEIPVRELEVRDGRLLLDVGSKKIITLLLQP